MGAAAPAKAQWKFLCLDPVNDTQGHGASMKLATTIGQDLRDAGMAQALEHAHEEWKARFLAEAGRLAGQGVPFSSNDVTEVAGLPPIGTRNAVGAAMHHAAHTLKLRKVGYVESRRTSRHAGAVALWQTNEG